MPPTTDFPRPYAQSSTSASLRGSGSAIKTWSKWTRSSVTTSSMPTAVCHRSMMAPDPAVDELEDLARTALPLLEEVADHAALVHVWKMLGLGVANFRGRWEDWSQAAERALRHASLAGQRTTHLFALELGLASGPRPADEALQTLNALLPENPHPS